MDYIIRKIKKSEYSLLDEFLYEAIFVPIGAVPPPKSIIAADELQIYVSDFGESKDDKGLGIGTGMMKAMLTLLKDCGYKRASLAVQKNNYAAKMYEDLGFEIIDENAEEYIMVNYFK